MKNVYTRITHLLALAGDFLQPLLLLALRLYWGWQFIGTGTGKLMDTAAFADRFQGWGVPLPHVSVVLAGSTEAACGLLLLVGLASRIAAIPLIFAMAVAYLTAERTALTGIFSNPDAFVSATPFLFMLAAVLVLVFGPGRYSLDGLLARRKASAPRRRA
jgi:putative oxidoreductase